MNNFVEKFNIDFYEDSVRTKEKKVKKYFEKLLSTDDVIVKLRVSDTRVNHYTIYTPINKEKLKLILSDFSGLIVKKNIIGRVDTISLLGKNGYTIKNVKGKARDELIEKEDEEFNKKKSKFKKD